MTIPDEVRRAAIDQVMAALAAGDSDGAHAIYHDDVVLEFPQSGERFEGLANFKEWRYGYPSDVHFEVRRISGSGAVWVRETDRQLGRRLAHARHRRARVSRPNGLPPNAST